MDIVPRKRRHKATYSPLQGTPEQRQRWLDRQKSTKKYFDHMMVTGQDHCAVCGWKLPEALRMFAAKPSLLRILEVHHVMPVCANGTDTFDNMVLLCPTHHRIADVLSGITDFGSKRAAGIIDRETLLGLLSDLDKTPDACGKEIMRKRVEAQAVMTELLSDLFSAG